MKLKCDKNCKVCSKKYKCRTQTKYKLNKNTTWAHIREFFATNNADFSKYFEEIKPMNKYKNNIVEYEGIKFHSEQEKDFYIFLMETYPKEIFDNIEIVLQPKFILIQNTYDKDGKKYRGINYIADFAIMDKRTEKFAAVYDVKGAKTKDFIMKEKLFKVKYPDTKLKLMTKSPKYLQDIYGKWCELDDLKLARKERKKLTK